MIHAIQTAKETITVKRPILLCLTNVVTMDFMANSLLALGAAPIMSCEEREIEELVTLSHAINLNIGTLDGASVARCHQAAEIAKQLHKPVILDPVGSGASRVRTNTARSLMPYAQIIRGNASEIMSLVDLNTKTAGVESTHSTPMAKESADFLAQEWGKTVIVSGQEDYITDGQRQESLRYGSSLMPLVTGMGCTLTAVVAAFRAVMSDDFEAARFATAYFGLCGEKAEQQSQAPGSFRTAFIDALYWGAI